MIRNDYNNSRREAVRLAAEASAQREAELSISLWRRLAELHDKENTVHHDQK